MYLDFKDVAMLTLAAFLTALFFNMGQDAYWALSGLVGLCRG